MSQTLKIQKPDLIALSIINVLFVFLVYISYSKWGMPIVDCFRNAYLAEHLTRGEVLYKDIYYFYCPIAPYFNALLFNIFGIHLNVLYTAGIFTSLIIVNVGFYLSRQLLNSTMACLTICAFTSMSIFRPGLFQYIFPYSYESLYGSLLLTVLLVCMLAIIKKEDSNKSIFLYISPIIVSLCMLLKQDAGISACLTYLVMIVTLYIDKKLTINKSLLTIALSFASFIIFFSIFIIFIPYYDLINGIFPTNIFSAHYIQVFSGSIITYAMVLNTIKMFILFTVCFSIITGFSYYIIKYGIIASKSINYKYIIAFLFLLMGISLVLPETFVNDIKKLLVLLSNYFNNNVIFQWIWCFSVTYFFFIIYKKIKKKISFEDSNYIVLLFTISSIFFLFRRFMAINLSTVSNFFILPALILCIYFIYKNIPVILSSINRKYYTYSVHIFIILLIASSLIKSYNYYKKIDYKLTTSRGTYTTISKMGPQLKDAISLVESSTNKNDYIFTPPEDLIINFMTGRKNASKYIQQLPGIIHSKKLENNLIKELEKNKPRIIFISNNNNVIFYGKRQWGYDYLQNTFKWIQKNYRKAGIISLKNPDQSIDTNKYLINIFVDKNIIPE